MGASMLIAGIEVIDQSVNAAARLASGFDFGEGEPDQTTIGSLYLDGDAVTGERRANRSMQIPLNIYGATSLAVSATIDAIRQVVNQPTFEVQWTPDGGLPIIFDAMRGLGTRMHNPDLDAAGGPANLLLTFQAKPFGRSPSLSTIAVSAPSTQLDNFDAARTGATLDTSIKYEGTGSNKVALTSLSGPGGSKSWLSGLTPLSHTFGTPQDLSADNAVSFRWRWPAPGGAATMTGSLTLTDSSARTLQIPRSKAFVNGDTNWRLVNFPIPTDVGAFDLTQVTGYSMEFTSTAIYGGGSSSSIWVEDMRGVPSATTQTTTTHGAQLLLPSTAGSARAPANLALSTGGTFGQFLLHSPPVDQDPDAGILVALNATLADQTVTIPAANANLRGTFSVVLGGATVAGAASITVTVTQQEGGSTVGGAWSKTVSWDMSVAGRLCPVGEVTLPLYDTPSDNSQTSYTVEVDITSGGDRYSELMLCDTSGQTILTDTAAPAAGSEVYVDEPSALQSGPSVYISSSDRTAAWGKMGDCVLSGGPILLEPGTNKFLMWTDSGTPSITATYYPRWLDERVA